MVASLVPAIRIDCSVAVFIRNPKKGSGGLFRYLPKGDWKGDDPTQLCPNVLRKKSDGNRRYRMYPKLVSKPGQYVTA